MKYWHGRPRLVPRLGALPLILVLLALGAGAPLAGCVSEQGDGSDVEHIGALSFNLEVAPGVTLNSVSYTLAKGDFTETGSIEVGDGPGISSTIGGIPEGTGYTITLTATSVGDETSFSGSAGFNVTAGETTSVTIHLTGAGASVHGSGVHGSSVHGSGVHGSVAVNATLNVAPVVDELSATPLTVFVGGSVTLTGAAADPDAGPSPLSYVWSTTGGVVDDPIAATTTLSSDTPGSFTVQLTVSDGELTTTKSTTIQFVGAETRGYDGPKRPNILLIIADDLGAEGTSVYPDLPGDSGAVPVPNIEALAENGLVFDNAWASPVCTPTRATIVSGLYGHRTGVTNVGDVLPTSTVSLFDRLTADSPSYEHAFIGKYHLGGGSHDRRPASPIQAGTSILQHVSDIGITNFRGILAGGVADYFNWVTYDSNGPNVATTTYATTALTDYAIDFIHEHEAEKPAQPWFVYQSYNAPHFANGGSSNAYQVPPRELHSVDLSSVGDPAPGTYAVNIPIYQANIQALDTELGRLLAEVDFEKTTVIFVGDNGTPLHVKDKRTALLGAKGSVYEGGVRVPLIVAGAGVTRRGREDDLVVTTDIYASVLALAGVPVSKVNDSYSLKPLLSDEAATSGRTHSFTEVSNGTKDRRYAIRDKRFKLIFNLQQRQLYDLVADPRETTNLYTNPEYAAVLASLQAEIAALRAETPAYFP